MYVTMNTCDYCLSYNGKMKDIIAHVIAFLLGAAVSAAYFINSSDSNQQQEVAGKPQGGPSQPIAPAGSAPNKTHKGKQGGGGRPPENRGEK